MKTSVSKMSLAVLFFLSAGIFSFTKPGGDMFEVYIGKDMVIRQALHSEEGVKEITIKPHQREEKISIRYSHCGKAGTNRSVTLKDEKNKVLKTLNFSEPRTSGSVMVFPVSDILKFQSGDTRNIRLYYASTELPEGKWLVSITK